MKCTIPEISWHNRDPVLSIDIQPFVNQEFYRLASGGVDCHVLIWFLKIQESGSVHVEIASDLTRHQRAVNVVRWSPSGQYLATGDDDANVIVWFLKTDSVPLLEGDTTDRETWLVFKVLRGHKDDVYDICWSPNSLKLLTGSVDNTAMLWDLTKGKNDCILSDHKGYVQGVTWDPKDQYLATLSSDRVCRVFDTMGKHVKCRIYRGQLPVAESHSLHNKEVKYYHDDTCKSFFRRLTFSPDGSLLITPSGCVETEDCKKALYATYIYTLDTLTRPAAVLPSPKQYTSIVRCCPILFELHSDGPDPIIKLSYRMVIAVATDSDVILYDTQQAIPFAHFQKIHYTRLTDLTWSSDGLLLIVSSTDGFCTLISFEPNELGEQYLGEIESETKENSFDISGCEELDKEEYVPSGSSTPTSIKKLKEVVDNKPKRPNILEQWAIKTPKKIKLDKQSKDDKTNSDVLDTVTMEVDENDSKDMNKCSNGSEKTVINKLIPRKKTSVKPINTQPQSDKAENTAMNSNLKNTDLNKKSSPVGVVNVKKINTTLKRITPIMIPKTENEIDKPKFNDTVEIITIDDSDDDKSPSTSSKLSNENQLQETDKKTPLKIGTVTSKSKSADKDQSNKSTSVRKKNSNETSQPNAKNSILKYLKNTPKINEKKNCINTNIIELNNEELARDSWTCDSKKSETAITERKELKDDVEVIEEISEDFTLQIEQSNAAIDTLEKNVLQVSDDNKSEILSSTVVIIDNTSTNKIVNDDEYNSENTTTLSLTENTKQDEMECLKSTTNSNEKSQMTTASTTDSTKLTANVKPMIKTHRRIPLITLSSPKSKKKKENSP